MRIVKYSNKSETLYKLSLICVFLIGLSSPALNQKLFKSDATIKRYINTNDSIVEFNVLSFEKQVKTKAECNYNWYQSDRIQQTENGYSGKLLHGLYQVFYYPSMKLKSQGNLKNGLRNGIWKSWYQNSNLKTKNSWKKGKLNGQCFFYNEKGEIAEILNYKNGILHGDCEYYKNGKLVITKKFKNGQEFIKVKRRQLKPFLFKKNKGNKQEPNTINKET
jgi:antitoxin component YwqK of YwqJK toxin-antitoxin module